MIATFDFEKMNVCHALSFFSIEHGDGSQKYSVVSGQVKSENRVRPVVIVWKKLPATLTLQSRTSETLNILTAVAYGATLDPGQVDMSAEDRERLEREALDTLTRAVSMTAATLRSNHVDVWRSFWTTGMGISHSMAEESVNGGQINATIYYVLSQAPAPIHAVHTAAETRERLLRQLVYSEGCYGGHPTV